MADGGAKRAMTRITPGPDTRRDFRDALGRFATGVTLVTCDSEIGPLGITANSFASLSLDPALVLWSPARSSRRFAAFTAARRFAIHILRDDQLDLARAFTHHGQAWDGVAWHPSPEGVPLLDDALARFECRQAALHDGGDHAIVVGEVTAAMIGDGSPLVFSGGGFGAFRAF
jgi:flavin reductase (DIM6/NTAB) family NADH-FMN oxidoreductase RutF